MFRSAHDTPLKVFIGCQCEPDNKAKYLTIEGNPPAEAVSEAWLNIYSEYCSIAGGSTLTSMLSKVKAVCILQSKMERVKKALEVAAQYRDNALCEYLTKEGYKLSMAVSEDVYEHQIRVAVSKVKTESLHLESLQSELEQDKEGDPKKAKLPNRADFIATLQWISKHAGYRVTEDMSVLEYAMHLKTLKESIRILNATTTKNAKR